MKLESCNEQYLRILTSGINGEADYEAAKYLKDKGYAHCEYIQSTMASNYGIWPLIMEK